jgi:hypothetical protein
MEYYGGGTTRRKAGPVLPPPMRRGPLCTDLSLLRQGFSLGARFGLHSLEALARVGLDLEEGVYRSGSLLIAPAGVRFRLTNPPLRVGAFHSVRVIWDGVPVAPDAGGVATERRPAARTLAAITPEDPLELGVGESSEFSLRLPPAQIPGHHRVRIEWLSVAVPPLVWLEFTDEPRAPREGE